MCSDTDLFEGKSWEAVTQHNHDTNSQEITTSDKHETLQRYEEELESMERDETDVKTAGDEVGEKQTGSTGSTTSLEKQTGSPSLYFTSDECQVRT